MKIILVGLIEIYQRYFSPLFLPRCRFYPSCSEYFRQSLIKYGLFKGVFRGIKRLMKCHPFSRGGYDPVK